MELQADERITTPNMKLRDIGKSTLMRLNFENECNLGVVIMVCYQLIFNKWPKSIVVIKLFNRI